MAKENEKEDLSIDEIVKKLHDLIKELVNLAKEAEKVAEIDKRLTVLEKIIAEKGVNKSSDN